MSIALLFHIFCRYVGVDRVILMKKVVTIPKQVRCMYIELYVHIT